MAELKEDRQEDAKDKLAEILACALSELEEGIAVLDQDSHVLFWNPAATAIAGYLSQDLRARSLPADFYCTVAHHYDPQHPAAHLRPVLVNLHHSQGHSLPAMLRVTPLRDALGRRWGTLLRFHPVEEIDGLPHGATEDEYQLEDRVEQSQAGMEDRLEEAWYEWVASSVPFGVLWITVDQASMLRKTHGRDASEAMLAIVERTLIHGLRPTEILGRWGTNEFLILCHERSPEMLKAHAAHICSLATTADFRWWGDRIELTFSIGAAQAVASGNPESLHFLLLQAQQAMQESIYLGGNHAAAITKL